MNKDKIISLIKDLRLGTSNVVDALGKKGYIPDLLPLISGFAVGEVYSIPCWHERNWITHKYLEDAPENRILFFDAMYCGDRAIIGHLMAYYACNTKKAIALVVRGNVRDLKNLIGFPVWCKGVNPVGCTREKVNIPYEQTEGVMVCDDDGVVLIDEFTQETYDKLVAIYEREKKWFSEVQQGLSTFAITCQK